MQLNLKWFRRRALVLLSTLISLACGGNPSQPEVGSEESGLNRAPRVDEFQLLAGALRDIATDLFAGKPRLGDPVRAPGGLAKASETIAMRKPGAPCRGASMTDAWLRRAAGVDQLRANSVRGDA